MKKVTYLFLIAVGLFLSSCYKDYFHDVFTHGKEDCKPLPQFNKLYGGSRFDAAYSITSSFDGGFVMAGTTNSNDGDVNGNHGGYDVWVVKLNSTGSIVWKKVLGGSSEDNATSIISTSDGGYIMAGYTASNNGDVSGNHGGLTDIWVVKLNSSGTIVWQKTLGGPETDIARSVIATPDGGYVIAGPTSSNGGDVSGYHGGEFDDWVVKLNSSGNIIWQKTLGGSKNEDANSIVTTTDGGYIMAGHTGSNDGDVSGNHGGFSDAWLVKLNSSGSIVWQKTLGGSCDDYATSIVKRCDGSYIMAGQTFSNDGDVSGNHGDHDAWVITIQNP